MEGDIILPPVLLASKDIMHLILTKYVDPEDALSFTRTCKGVLRTLSCTERILMVHTMLRWNESLLEKDSDPS